jgi:hypothetical protein
MMHSQEITADFDTLLRQSSMTSDTYMREAVENIDKMFGKGHAKAYPDLLIAFSGRGFQWPRREHTDRRGCPVPPAYG